MSTSWSHFYSSSFKISGLPWGIWYTITDFCMGWDMGICISLLHGNIQCPHHYLLNTFLSSNPLGCMDLYLCSLFYWSTYFFSCQCHAVSITTVLQYNLKAGIVMSPAELEGSEELGTAEGVKKPYLFMFASLLWFSHQLWWQPYSSEQHTLDESSHSERRRQTTVTHQLPNKPDIDIQVQN